MKQSQSILIFLSKGYFFSANCKKEIAATLANGNPVMLLHETDPNRGGTSIEQMLADCPDDWREEIFVPRRPIIPWLRIKEFKIVSLKMIVSSMLLHQNKKMERKLQALDEDIHAIPAESAEANLRSSSSRKRAFASVCQRFSANSSRSCSSAGAGAGGGAACEPTMTTESCASTLGEESSAVYAAQKWFTSAEGAAFSNPSCSASAQAAEDSKSAAASAENVQEGGRELPVHCGSAGLRTQELRFPAPEVGLYATGAEISCAHLYVSGEVTRQELRFPPVVLVISFENPGASNLAQVAILAL